MQIFSLLFSFLYMSRIKSILILSSNEGVFRKLICRNRIPIVLATPPSTEGVVPFSIISNGKSLILLYTLAIFLSNFCLRILQKITNLCEFCISFASFVTINYYTTTISSENKDISKPSPIIVFNLLNSVRYNGNT